MSDTIGRVTVPAMVDSGTAFPLISDFGYGFVQDNPIVLHRFGELDAKAEQRYQVGNSPKKHRFIKQNISQTQRNSLVNFWEALNGPWKTFLYNVPNANQTTTSTKVIWDATPLSLEYMVHACRTGLNFVEVPDPAAAPSYAVASTSFRFPSAGLQTALLSQVQQIIPLVHIRVQEAAVADIYLSDRRCTVGGQLYLPRVVGFGEPGSGDVLVSQDIEGSADQVQFTFGNADRVMTALSNDTDLKFAVIDVCLYHVNSQILLQLWKGFITDFTTDGSSVFRVAASDGLYQVSQLYPNRTVSRLCWKTFNDGVNCPWASVSGVGDATTCDYYFDSVKGCLSHGMGDYFGGHPAVPEGVNIKDNSTGVMGFGRNRVTATSIISDTIWGQALPEIWCNSGGDPTKAFWVNALIAAGRDESDFYDALGIIGAGPIGAFTPMTIAQNADGYRYIVTPLLDGQPPHGFKVSGGLTVISNSAVGAPREVLGTDPQSDGFSLSSGGKIQDNIRAAGTAFIEVRRTDQKGIQPTTDDQHELKVPLDRGLSGWTWNASNVRSSVAGLTNVFWVAVNSYLRALGLQSASSAAQLATFVRSSVFVGDGSGCAEIADLSVPVIVGVGNETQFQFQGTLSQQKPFRDWLKEILNCALGYYTWEFGQLKFGIRENASAVDTYTIGNMVFQSLQLSPIKANFEKLIIDYADQAYQYQANTVEYQDKTHAATYGRNGNPLTQRMRSLGAPTLSQNLRIAATRTREEIGGINAAEWRAARIASWKTTLLGLNNEVGQVVSITHPDVPGGSAKFRIKSWRLMRDYSVVMTGQTVADSMYDLTVGPKPQDVNPHPLPPLVYALPLEPAWCPFQVQYSASDVIYPSTWTFDLAQVYSNTTEGNVLANAQITGKQPTNQFMVDTDGITSVGSPVVGTITVNSVGGSLSGGQTLRLSLVAYDSNMRPSSPKNIAIIVLPSGTNTYQVVLSNITWPSITGLAAYTIFASPFDDGICAQQLATTLGGVPVTGLLTVGTPSTAYTPTSVTFNGPLTPGAYALPNPYVKGLRLKVKKLTRAGTYAMFVNTVGTNTINVTPEIVDGSGTYANFNQVGRVLTAYGRPEGTCPLFNATITACTVVGSGLTQTWNLTLSMDPTAILAPKDLVVIRFKAVDNSGNRYVASDLGIVNSMFPTGMTPHELQGKLFRVIKGASTGLAPVKIVDNTTTDITLEQPVVLAAGDIYITEEPAWVYTYDVTGINNTHPNVVTSHIVPMSNLMNQSLLFSGFTISNYGESPDADQTIREMYFFGKGYGFTKITAASYAVKLSDNYLAVDTTSNNVTIQLQPSAVFRVRPLTIQKISSDTNTITILPATGETINGAASLTLKLQWSGFVVVSKG